MSQLLRQLKLTLRRLRPHETPTLDGVALQRGGDRWAHAQHETPRKLVERIKPMTEEEAAAALEVATQYAEDAVDWEIEQEDARAEDEAKRAARADPAGAARIIAAAAEARAQRAEEAPAK